MNMLSLFPAIPVLMMLGLWLSKSARQREDIFDMVIV